MSSVDLTHSIDTSLPLHLSHRDSFACTFTEPNGESARKLASGRHRRRHCSDPTVALPLSPVHCTLVMPSTIQCCHCPSLRPIPASRRQSLCSVRSPRIRSSTRPSCRPRSPTVTRTICHQAWVHYRAQIGCQRGRLHRRPLCFYRPCLWATRRRAEHPIYAVLVTVQSIHLRQSTLVQRLCHKRRHRRHRLCQVTRPGTRQDRQPHSYPTTCTPWCNTSSWPPKTMPPT